MRIACLLVLGMAIAASSLALQPPDTHEKTAETVAQVLGMAIATAGLALRAPDTPEKTAETVAQSWLALVDSGQYGESWDAAAAFFKQAVTRPQWVDALTKVRSPLGKLESRKLRAAKYVTDMPGAPAGEYVVIEYDARFASGGDMIERITPMKDPDGAWRVSGYFILPAK